MKIGVPLPGKDGVLAPLLENLLNNAMEGEIDSHLEGSEREFGNHRNKLIIKQVQTVTGNQEYIKIGNEATSKMATIVHQNR